jgi:transcriptional regulator with XRE-family HTH domain
MPPVTTGSVAGVPPRKSKRTPVPKRFTSSTPPPTTEQLNELAGRLKYARDARELGSNALGRLAEVGVGAVSKIEKGKRGKRPTSEIITKLATALNIDRSWLDVGKSSDGRIFLDQPRDDADLREQVAALKLQVGAILTATEIPDPVPTPLKQRRSRHLKPVPPKR